jgi:hypothetical protein
MECPISEERDTFFKNGTDAQDRCRSGNKCVVLRESLFNSIILEHYRKIRAAKAVIREVSG